MKKTILTLLGIMLGSALFAQNKEIRKVEPFTRLSFNIPGDVIIKQGETQSVELQGDAELLSKIKTEVTGDKLVIGNKTKWNFNDRDKTKTKVYITVASIKEINISGSGDLTTDGKFLCENLDLKISGSGNIKFEGTINGDLEASIAGSGDFVFKGTCRNAHSNVSGSGNMKLDINVEEEIKLRIAGSGDIKMEGKAKTFDAKVSGSGNIHGAGFAVTKADVDIAGSGDVSIDVKDELNSSIAGSGSLRYKGRPDHLKINTKGSGSVRSID